MKTSRGKAFGLFVLFSILTVFCGLAFIDNIDIVVKYWRDFNACAGDSTKMAAKYAGILPLFDWACVDYSCVTTLIPFFGFLLAAVGCRKLLAGKKIASADTFPYFPSTDLLNISLGLIGTLWGIIVIGYYDMNTVQIDILIQCLHTALFSTLMAVVWVYLIDHPLIRPALQRMLSDDDLNTDDDELAVTEIIDRLREGADGIHKAWRQESESLDKLVSQMTSAGQSLVTVTSAAEKAGIAIDKNLTSSVQAFVTKLASAADQIEAQRREADAAAARRMAELDAAFQKRISHLDEQSARAIKTMESFQATLGTIEAACAKLRERTESLVAENDAERAKSAELLTAKVRLEGELTVAADREKAAAARAAAAETSLGKIRKVFSGE